jgi:hypothetical protein
MGEEERQSVEDVQRGDIGVEQSEESGSVIPVIIAKRGKAAVRAYNAALRGGKQKLCWTKLMFVGNVKQYCNVIHVLR